MILLEPQGEKRLLLVPGVSMYPTRDAAGRVDLSGVKWVHTAVYDTVTASHLVGRCREAAVRWSIDLEPATFSDGIESLADPIDGAEVVFCNARAATQLGPRPVFRLLQMGARAVVFSRGAEGQRCTKQDELWWLLPATGSGGSVNTPMTYRRCSTRRHP